MKITIDIDCTPEEARSFLGLPDLAPMQQAVMQRLQEEMIEKMGGLAPETMLKSWMPAGMEGLDALQKTFWSQMTGGGGKKD